MRFRRLPLLLPLAALAVGTPSASAASCAGADVAPGGQPVAAARQAVLCLTNEQRAAAGATALRSEDHLQRAGQAFADSMVERDFFAHVGPDGSTLAERLADYEDWTTIGENLVTGTGSLATPRAAVTAWMNSAGHRKNLLNPSFREVGIGITQGSPGAAGGDAATYVADYGARATSSYASDDDAVVVLPVGSATTGLVTSGKALPSASVKPAPKPTATPTAVQTAAPAARPASSGSAPTVAAKPKPAARTSLARRCASATAARRAGVVRRCAAIRARVRARQAARAKKKSRKAAVVLQKAMSSHGTSPSAKARTSGASGVGFASPSANAS